MLDVIIVGNGFTGGTLAYALAEQGLSVALVDHQDPSLPLPVDGKSLALSHSSLRLFSRLGLWHALETTPISVIHTSDGLKPRWIQYTEKDLPEGPLGYVVESSLLKTLLWERVCAHPRITLYAPTAAIAFKATSSSACVTLKEGTILEAPLCVASDGKFSGLRKALAIPTREWSYDQLSIVCNVRHTLPHQNYAFEHFLPSGPLALLPRSGKTSGMVWSIERSKGEALLNLSPEEFSQEIVAHFGSSLGTFTLISERWSYPLSVCLPQKLISHRFALLGDAAHSFHPVAGQGLNVGLRDVACLAEILEKSASFGLDLGAKIGLEEYQRKRRPDILSMTLATDGIVRLFSTHSPLASRLRSFGFGAVKHLSPLKRLMVRHAAGLL